MDLIVVSQLCCSICWEIIKILRGNGEEFEIRGRHSMLYALELPQHLPFEVLDGLIQRFKGFLQTEFQLMFQKWHKVKKTHNRTPSDQSDSAVSVRHPDRGTAATLPSFRLFNWHFHDGFRFLFSQLLLLY
jgi:hypothetical protein